jgi:hypothetical protein
MEVNGSSPRKNKRNLRRVCVDMAARKRRERAIGRGPKVRSRKRIPKRCSAASPRRKTRKTRKICDLFLTSINLLLIIRT